MGKEEKLNETLKELFGELHFLRRKQETSQLSNPLGREPKDPKQKEIYNALGSFVDEVATEEDLIAIACGPENTITEKDVA